MDLTKARDGSLLAKYVAGAVMLLGMVAIGLGWLKLSVQDLAFGAMTILAIFGTVDLNLMLEKITGRKGGA